MKQSSAAITDTKALIPLLMGASKKASEGSLKLVSMDVNQTTGAQTITVTEAQAGDQLGIPERIGLAGQLRVIAMVIEYENGWSASMVHNGRTTPPTITFTLHSPVGDKEGV